MSTHLLVAEVDKIQSFVFQSARLREVVGASHLLEQFCGERATDWNQAGYTVLSSRGGSFRVLIEGEVAAANAAGELRRQFEADVGGSITITIVENKSPISVIQDGNEALRRAKLEGGEPQAVWHLPYHAICQSSGVELAVAYQHPGGYENDKPRHPEERRRYLGRTTLAKGDETAAIELLDGFVRRMARDERYGRVRRHDKATEADTYAVYDDRQYVAYLKADGNGMGAIFGSCPPNKLTELSNAVPEITAQAIIEAISPMGAFTYRGGQMQFPALPLITGGDDVFMLMPAPWAVDVAARFCSAYESGMGAKLQSFNSVQPATTGLAVVICKASYPYKLAHNHAEELLSRAKRKAKSEAVQESCLTIDFVTGSDSVNGQGRTPPLVYTPDEARYLLTYRYALRDFPAKKLYELEKAVRAEDGSAGHVLKRIADLYPEPSYPYAGLLESALQQREAFLELVKLWDFVLDMKYPREAYRPQER